MPVTSAFPDYIRNRLLAALISKDYQHLLPYLERVQLSLGEVIYRAEAEIHYVYFPENATVSLLSTLENGQTAEVGIIGYEGMVGLNIFLGGAVTHDQALVQIAGTALRMKTSVLRAELQTGSPLQFFLLNYTRAFIALISQSIICSQHHIVSQRLARWLLVMHDYAEANELRLTHEMIAAMIGARRAGVTNAASPLRDAGLIKYHRGRITITDRKGLEASACECYQIIREEFDRMQHSQTDEKNQNRGQKGPL